MPCIHDAHVVPPAVSILICTLLSDLCQHDRSVCVFVCVCCNDKQFRSKSDVPD